MLFQHRCLDKNTTRGYYCNFKKYNKDKKVIWKPFFSIFFDLIWFGLLYYFLLFSFSIFSGHSRPHHHQITVGDKFGDSDPTQERDRSVRDRSDEREGERNLVRELGREKESMTENRCLGRTRWWWETETLVDGGEDQW